MKNRTGTLQRTLLLLLALILILPGLAGRTQAAAQGVCAGPHPGPVLWRLRL